MTPERCRQLVVMCIAVCLSLAHVNNSIAATPDPIRFDLSRWTVVQYEWQNQGAANWVFSEQGNVARQTNNADASILLSRFTLRNETIDGTWRVDTSVDDDFIGFVFGYQDRGNYYLFDWKQEDQTEIYGLAERGMSLKVVSMPPGSDPTLFDLGPSSGSEHVRVLRHNQIAWDDFTDYQFHLEFHAGAFIVEVRAVLRPPRRRSTLLESWIVEDETFTSGRFGFYNFSQNDVLYEGFTRTPNEPPIARCRDVVRPVATGCSVSIDPGELDAGSFDPEGGVIEFSLAPPGPYGLGPTSVVLTVTDDAGLQATCEATVTVEDHTLPSIGCPNDLTVDCDGVGNTDAVDAWLRSPEAFDACGDVSVTHDFIGVSDECGATGTAVVTWTATDDAGNSAACSAMLSVVDATAPTLSGIPDDITVACDAVPAPADPTVADDCDPAPIIEFEESVNGVSECGTSYTLVRTWTATDECGNRSSRSQALVVERSPVGCPAIGVALDDIPPTITCPADATIGCDWSLLPLVTGEATATDNCDAFPRISYRDSLTEVPCPAVLARVWTAVDVIGNTSECTQAISVVDVSSTEGIVYWTDPVLAEVYQLDTQDEEDSAIRLETGPLSPQGIAVDPAGRHVYWASQTPGGRFEDAIFRANLDLTGVEEWVATLDRPVDLALDTAAGKLYWTANRAIQRANLDGSNVETVIGDLTKPTGIDLDLFAGKVYWTDESDRAIRRANLDGSNVELLLAVSLPGVPPEIIEKSLQEPRGIALDPAGGKFYWTDFIANTISRADLDGSNPELLIEGLNGPEFIKVEPVARMLYWAMSTGQLNRSNLDGTGREPVKSTHHPVGIALAFSQSCPSELAEVCARPSELLQIVGGLGGVNPTTGLADTFISPLAEHVALSEIAINVSVDSELVSAHVLWTGSEAEAPVVAAYISDGHGRHTVVLDPRLAAGDWARIRLTVRSRVSSVTGTFTIWIAHHPGDTNQDGIVDVRDATEFGGEFRGRQAPTLIDLNGDGAVDVRDATTFGEIWRGAGNQKRPWAGHELPPKPE